MKATLRKQAEPLVGSHIHWHGTNGKVAGFSWQGDQRFVHINFFWGATCRLKKCNEKQPHIHPIPLTALEQAESQEVVGKIKPVTSKVTTHRKMTDEEFNRKLDRIRPHYFND